MTTPLTPAEFALGEVRFKKQFRKLSADLEATAMPIDQYVELPRSERGARVPFVYATDDARHLIKVACSTSIVNLVEDRRRYWQVLQYLSGGHEAELTALHREDLEALRAQYDEAMKGRESSIDDIVRAMSELAASSKAPVGLGGFIPTRSGAAAAAAAPAAAAASAAPVGVMDLPIYLDPAEQALCNDCGTCYQELPQLFRKTTMVVDGAAATVAEMIPGAVEKLEITPELQKRIDRVRATCDSEILR